MKTGLILAYVIAGGGAAVSVVQANNTSERLMAIALLLFTADLARMAIVDIDNLRRVHRQASLKPAQVSALLGFRYSLAATIVLELLGLLISWRWVGAGISLVMLSQLLFNLSVKVSVDPHSQPAIRPWPIRERLDVLIADSVALGLAVVWSVTNHPVGIAITILMMVVVYLAIKYGSLARHITSKQEN